MVCLFNVMVQKLIVESLKLALMKVVRLIGIHRTCLILVYNLQSSVCFSVRPCIIDIFPFNSQFQSYVPDFFSLSHLFRNGVVNAMCTMNEICVKLQ